MDQGLIGLAFAAGTVAALNPCGFAMLPAYLTMVIDTERNGQVSAVMRALAATAMMALGFLTVFGLFGLLTVSIAATVQQYLPYVTVVIGGALIGLGVWYLSGRELTLSIWNPLGRNAHWAPTPRLGSMLGYGVAYAIASLSCTIGPFLAITGGNFRTGRPAEAALAYLAYAAGIALVVGVLAIAVALSSATIVDKMRRVLPYIHRVSGALLVAAGLYVGYYGIYEVRLFAAGAEPDDPVISAAGTIQRTLAGWVYHYGAWPWLLTLGVVATGTTAAWAHRRKCHPRGHRP